jgi:hypothetical protein
MSSIAMMMPPPAGMVLGLNATALSGAWKCLTCGFYMPTTPQDSEDGSIPTCGQRKTQYCAGPCHDMRNFEWATQGYYVAPSAPTSSNGASTVPRSHDDPRPKLPEDLSAYTDEELHELKGRIDKTLQDRKLCTVCCATKCDVIFYPCKHRAACKGCAAKLSSCPICRSNIQDLIAVE